MWTKIRETSYKGVVLVVLQDKTKKSYYKFRLSKGKKKTTITTKVEDDSVMGMQEKIRVLLEDFNEME